MPSLLVIDDEPDNFDVIEALLPKSSYELYYTASGEDAISQLDIINPDLILLDVMMPGMDGIEVCKKIKSMAKWQPVPIIMVTALSSKEDLARALKAGADDFVSKPVNGLELRARVHSMLRIKEQYDRIQSFTKLQQNTIRLLTDNLKALRGNLATSLPHELNTPLSGVLGGIRLLINDIDSMDAESIHELLNLAYDSALRLERLTQKFSNYLSLELASSLPATDTLTGDKEDSFGELSSSIFIKNFALIIAQQHNRVDDLVCQIEPAELAVASYHVQWIVDELVENAFKFSQPNTPVTIRGECKDEMFHLWIGDRGRGMTNMQIAQSGVFMQFDRKTYEQQGMGLGLTIAEKAVKLYGGRFLIDSIYKQETTIHLTLPLRTATEYDNEDDYEYE